MEDNNFIKEEVSRIRKPTYSIDPAFLNRWSPRSFLDKKVPEDILLSIFEAARWAPSANNEQPWRFVISRTTEDHEKFYSFIRPKNLIWCKKAPVLALLFSTKMNSATGEYNKFHAFDAGTAWGFLSLEAFKKGLITHAIGGFDREKAYKILNISQAYDLHTVIAIGYQGKKSLLPENLQKREQPSNRRPLLDSVFEGSPTILSKGQ